jgi:hypothetical protein
MTTNTIIPVDSIVIPGEFVDIASQWYSGQSDLLYAVASTGNLTTGSRCPITDYTDDDDRDQKWYLTLWRDLSVDVGYARRAAAKGCNGESDKEDHDILEAFEDWVDEQAEQLAQSYQLEDWEQSTRRRRRVVGLGCNPSPGHNRDPQPTPQPATGEDNDNRQPRPATDPTTRRRIGKREPTTRNRYNRT